MKPEFCFCLAISPCVPVGETIAVCSDQSEQFDIQDDGKIFETSE